MVTLITGAAGFIGCHLALHLRERFPNGKVIGLDNLKRRGSELNVARLMHRGVKFIHGDIRNPEDFCGLPDCDALIECSAEPSVLAAFGDASHYVTNTNLVGTLNCLEFARNHAKAVLFLSTSRVYPVAALNQLNLRDEGSRFVLESAQPFPGVSAAGIDETFPLSGSRTLYGASKLCSELLLEEYAAQYKFAYVINRCGLVAGPWQWARSDQGVVTMWAARHYFGGDLSYIGYGGEGKQVRDVLHVADLLALIEHQLQNMCALSGSVFNVGGGPNNAVSLAELTAKCNERAGRLLSVGSESLNRPGDIPYYVSDNQKATAATGWTPTRGVDQVLDDLFKWFHSHETEIKPYLAG